MTAGSAAATTPTSRPAPVPCLPPLLAPVGVLLSPLAVLIWAIQAVVRRPSMLVAGTLVIACLPSDRGDVAASVHVTPADLGALVLVAVIGVRVLRGDRPLVHRAWPPFALVLVALAVATVTAQDPGASLAPRLWPRKSRI